MSDNKSTTNTRTEPQSIHNISQENYSQIDIVGGESPPDKCEYVLVTFVPQVPYNGRLIDADDTWSYLIPIDDATTDNGILYETNVEESDTLAFHEHAPTPIIKALTQELEWPYKITIDTAFIRGDSNE